MRYLFTLFLLTAFFFSNAQEIDLDNRNLDNFSDTLSVQKHKKLAALNLIKFKKQRNTGFWIGLSGAVLTSWGALGIGKNNGEGISPNSLFYVFGSVFTASGIIISVDANRYTEYAGKHMLYSEDPSLRLKATIPIR